MRAPRNKFERVQLPRHFGLNAENSVLVKEMVKLRYHKFVKNRNEFSVRTFYRDDRKDFGLKKKAPHLCTTTKKNLLKRAPKLFKDGLWLIVADQVDAKDCEFRGTIWINSQNLVIVEIAVGPGTVRSVTNDGVIDKSWTLRPKDRTDDSKLDYCIKQCRKTKLRNVIFEFSYYKIPIGWKNEQFICWEITDDGSHQCRLFKEQ